LKPCAVNHVAMMDHVTSAGFLLVDQTGISIMPVMIASASQPVRMIRRLAVFALVLWLAGVGCFLGCEMSVSAAPVAKTEASGTADSCPMASHDCCQKAKGDGTQFTEPTQQRTDAPSCCPLTDQFAADPARKVRSADAPLAAVVSELLFASNYNPTPKLSSQKPLVSNKGSTYLRCCVFLI